MGYLTQWTFFQLVADSTESFFAISKLYYTIGDIENSLGLVFRSLFFPSFVSNVDYSNDTFLCLFSQIRECLKLNPDHKECFPFYKRVKKLHKMKESLDEKVKVR